VDSGVPNPAGSDGRTFLDAVWDAAPFPGQAEFLARVEEVTGEWAERGAFSQAQEDAIMTAAQRAEEDLRV